jgi:hypothetical protein
MSEQEFREKVFERLGDIDDRLKHDTVRTVALVVAALCLIVAGVSAGFAITSREALHDQQRTNQVLLCAQGRSVAAAAAFRSQRQNESREQFLERMLAQRFQLLALGNLDCPDLPGFDTFAFQRAKALTEIDRILQRLAPQRYRQIIGAQKDATEDGPIGAVPPATALAPELPSFPSPGGGGGTGGKPGSSGGHGDSTGEPGNPPPKNHPPPKPPSEGGSGGGQAPPSPPANSGEGQPPAGGGGQGGGAGQEEPGPPENVLTPVLESTCLLNPVDNLLCVPR